MDGWWSTTTTQLRAKGLPNIGFGRLQPEVLFLIQTLSNSCRDLDEVEILMSILTFELFNNGETHGGRAYFVGSKYSCFQTTGPVEECVREDQNRSRLDPSAKIYSSSACQDQRSWLNDTLFHGSFLWKRIPDNVKVVNNRAFYFQVRVVLWIGHGGQSILGLWGKEAPPPCPKKKRILWLSPGLWHNKVGTSHRLRDSIQTREKKSTSSCVLYFLFLSTWARQPGSKGKR